MPNQEPDIVEQVKKRRAEKEAEEAQAEADSEEISDEELDRRARKEAIRAQYLTRGVMNDKLNPESFLGEHYDRSLHYEWVRRTDQDVERARAIGFHTVEKPEGWDESRLHPTAGNELRLGDVRLMAIPRDEYELIEEVRQEIKERKKDAGKKEYLKTSRQRNPDVPVLNPNNVEA